MVRVVDYLLFSLDTGKLIVGQETAVNIMHKFQNSPMLD